jgi:tripartite-type tricarboxylate transporter receptor subunit TctC
VVVENRSGGFQLLSIKALQASAPDGYTLFMASASSLVTMPTLRSDMGYDPLVDFSPIAMLVKTQGVLTATPNGVATSTDSLISYAREHPGQVNFASAGVGASNHVLLEFIKNTTGTSTIHVPFRSDPEAVIGISTGTVQIGLVTAQTAVPFIRNGRLKTLAVTGAQRLPEVPSFAESAVPALKSIDAYTFSAPVGPKDTPPEAVRLLNAAFNKISQRPEVVAEVTGTLVSDPPTLWSPEEFRRYLEGELAKWREAGRSIKVD